MLDVEITQAGSSRDLDTTIFLYRNESSGAPSRIAVDDDEGWGALSRIRDFRLYSEGEYTIVVGTKGADGRGRFRLSLGCSSGDCEPETPTAECHPALQQSLEECFIEISQYESDFEMPAHEMLEECREWVSYATESVCPEDDEPLCEDSQPFEEACYAGWESEYVQPATGLSREASDGLDDLSEVIWNSEACDIGEDAGCWWKADLYAFAGEAPKPAALMAYAREQSDVGPGAFLDQRLDAGTDVLSHILGNFEAEAAFEAFASDAGLDLAEAQVSVGESLTEFSWNFGDCQGALLTVTFPSAQRVLVLQDLLCYG